MSILIKNSIIVTQNAARKTFFGNIYIEDDRIVELSVKPIAIEADFKINGQGKVVIPGLVNLHTHLPMTLLRGYGDDMTLTEWLENKIWPVESKLTTHTVEAGAQLGLLEMLSSGTTTFLDMYFFEDTIGEVCVEGGIRAFLGFGLLDYGTPEYSSETIFKNCELFIKRWKNHSLIKPVIAPHGTYTCGPENLQKTRDLFTIYNVPIHIHCSETRDEVYNVKKKYGRRPLAQLKYHNLLTDKTILAHCGWITKNEIIDIITFQSKIAHCPVSNMKIATGGYTPLPELIEKTVTVGLGTDGAASNNTLDMFDTMKFCALIHKHHRWDPKIIPANTALDMATCWGAHALGIGNHIGSIEQGKKADIIIVDFYKPHLIPKNDIISHLVYAVKGSDVCTTIVNGKLLFHDNEFLTLDKDFILTNAEQCAKDLTSKV